MALPFGYIDYRKLHEQKKEEKPKPIVHCYRCRYKGDQEGTLIKCTVYNMLCELDATCKSGELAEG